MSVALLVHKCLDFLINNIQKTWNKTLTLTSNHKQKQCYHVATMCMSSYLSTIVVLQNWLYLSLEQFHNHRFVTNQMPSPQLISHGLHKQQKNYRLISWCNHTSSVQLSAFSIDILTYFFFLTLFIPSWRPSSIGMLGILVHPLESRLETFAYIIIPWVRKMKHFNLISHFLLLTTLYHMRHCSQINQTTCIEVLVNVRIKAFVKSINVIGNTRHIELVNNTCTKSCISLVSKCIFLYF